MDTYRTQRYDAAASGIPVSDATSHAVQATQGLRGTIRIALAILFLLSLAMAVAGVFIGYMAYS